MVEHKHIWIEIGNSWDFDRKYNSVVEECKLCKKTRENDEEGNWIYQ